MNFETFLADLKRAQETGEAFVVVTLVHAKGSTPQETGARLIVVREGYFSGTVGGGKLENTAIAEAKKLIAEGTRGSVFKEWNLQTDIGMSCGGAVGLFFEVHNPHKVWRIVLFGAGHVAQEISRVLLRLDCALTVVDQRPEWLDRLPKSSKLTVCHESKMPDFVERIPEGSYVIIATMGHGTDLPILEKLLSTRELPYVGVIGSDLKAKKLRHALVEDGVDPQAVEKFFCPMGEKFGNDTPPEIAISVVAQLLKIRG